MSPLAHSLLSTPHPIARVGTPESVDLLVDAIMCHPDPTTLKCSPVVCLDDPKHPVAHVDVCLGGVKWRLTSPDALTAGGRLILSRTPFVARRQAYRLCQSELADAAKKATDGVSVFRCRGAH